MPLQRLPRTAEAYSRSQRREIAAALAAVKRQWRRMGADFDASWAAVGPAVLAVLNQAQQRVTVGAKEYIPAVLAETRDLVPVAEYELGAAALVGVAGNGMPTSSVMQGSVIESKKAVAAGATTAGALAKGGQWLTLASSTLLSDTARTAEKVTGNARHVGTYVRMLNPPSCGRCAILAGKKTSSSVAFERHEGCDCRNVPASESVVGDMLVDPDEYLSGLSDEDLARTLGSKANAQAWRDGADAGQLVNAYKSKGYVTKAQDGRKFTYAGTTKRGAGGRAMAMYGVTGPRLMPETIYQIASDRAEAILMLHQFGWIL